MGLRTDHGWPDDLVLVPIDDAAQRDLGRWPWPRTQTATMIDRLHRLGAKTILLDGLLAAPTDPKDDAALAAAIDADGVVLPVSYDPQGYETSPDSEFPRALIAIRPIDTLALATNEIVLPTPVFAMRAHGIGHTFFYAEPDGLVRGHYPFLRVESGGKELPGMLPTLGLVALARQRGFDPASVEVDDHGIRLPGAPRVPLYSGEMYLDIAPHGVAPPAVRAADVMRLTPATEPAMKALLDGKLALVHISSTVSPDTMASPFGNDTPGGFLVAVALRTLALGHVPRPVDRRLALLLAAIPMLAMAIPLSRRPPGFILGAGAISAIAAIAIGVALVPIADRFAPIAGPAAFLLLASAGLAALSSRTAEDERRRLRALVDASLAPEGPTPRPAAALAGAGAAVFASRLAPGGEEKATRASDPQVAAMAELVGGRALAQPVKLGRYTVLRSLGRGGMGTIFYAIDRDLDRAVAVKVLEAQSRDAYQRFRREALAVARISHPNVVQIHEVGFDSSVPYIVMEYVGGGTLSDVLRGGSRLPWRQASRLIAGVARGLGAAHAKGIVHRDVKPSNLLLVEKGGIEAKVADFGIAKLTGGEQVTREGSFVGTVGYLSPEQAVGKSVDSRSDVYSLGVTWYRLLTGRAAHEGTTAQVLMATVQERVGDPRELNPDIPESIVHLLERMTEPDPEGRPANGAVVATAIESLVG